MMEEPAKSDPGLKTLLLRQAITVGGVVLAAWLTKRVSQPDFGKVFRMQCALTVKRVADTQATAWQNVSMRAATAYQKARV